MATQSFAVTDVSALRQAKLFLRETAAASAFVYVLLVAASQLAQGQQTITVKFVDFKSGKPIKNFYLLVEAWSGKWAHIVTKDATTISEGYNKAHHGTVTIRLPPQRSEAATVVFEASTKADKEGKVIIHLPETPPEQIEIFSGDLAQIVTVFSPAEVLGVGAVVPFRKDKADSQLKVGAKPGEIVIVNKRITAWERMLQEIP